MTFQLWTMTDQESRCFAVRSQEEIREEFHDMKIGECRQLTDGIDIIRVT